MAQVKEIEPNSGWFKIRTDTDEKTTYEIQNKSPTPIVAVFTFFDFENILFEAPREVQFKGNATYALTVPAGATRKAVELFTKIDGQPWKFDYDLRIEPQLEERPAWM